MPRLNIPGCFVALYEEAHEYTYPQPVPEWSRLILAYDKDRQISLDPGGTRFPTLKILPKNIWPKDRRYTMILYALYFQDSQIGYVLFEVGPPDWQMYNVLRTQISSSLQGAQLFEQTQQRTEQLDTIVTETLTTSEEMLAAISEASQQAQIVSNAAQASMNVSKSGLDAVSNTISGMERIRQLVEDIAQSILSLSKNSLKIEEILIAVENIVEQSKILALNASIQAARAGNNGKGFHIVAREMRSLAEKSRQETARISAILGEVKSSANAAILVAKNGSKGTQQGMELANHAGEAIHELTATIDKAAQLSIQIASTTQQQTKSMSQLVTAIQSIKNASAMTSNSFKEFAL